MNLFQFITSRFKRFQPQSVTVAHVGQMKSDRFGGWNCVRPFVFDRHKIDVSFITNECPPGEEEVAFFKKVESHWPDLWNLITSKLRHEMEDDGPSGELAPFFARVHPTCISFHDLASGQWEVELAPDLYGGHIVTMEMTDLKCDNVRMDG